MFKIGEFSKLAFVTIKALRFYDEEGLLKPKSVDRWTGYRYYESEQLYDLNKIISLRQAGLSISEIKSIVSGNDTVEILKNRQAELRQEMTSANEQYLRITKLLNSLKEKESMEFQAIIKDLPSYTVFYGEKKLHEFADLNNFILGLGEECSKANVGLKCLSPDYCFVSYMDEEFTPTDFTAMYAQAVEKAGNETKNVKFKKIPATTVVSVIVKGEYTQNLPLGYAFAIKWIKEHGYQMSEKPRECYIDGVWNKENACEWVTEIQLPIVKK